jgi:murein DD-endopeptidase MepM/ murein hydrolase activator NlpD
VGDFVIAGQHIGITGDTGNAFGIHLYLTLQHIGHGLKNYVVDDVVDPFPFFHLGPPQRWTN